MRSEAIIVTVMKETPYAYVVDLKCKILEFVESCYRYNTYFFITGWQYINLFCIRVLTSPMSCSFPALVC